MASPTFDSFGMESPLDDRIEKVIEDIKREEKRYDKCISSIGKDALWAMAGAGLYVANSEFQLGIPDVVAAIPAIGAAFKTFYDAYMIMNIPEYIQKKVNQYDIDMRNLNKDS